jgi:hypothetical protein
MKISELTPLTSGFTPNVDLVPILHAGRNYSMRVVDFGAGSGSGGGGGGDFPEAPMDGLTYGRQSALWAQVISANDDVIDCGNFITWR